MSVYVVRAFIRLRQTIDLQTDLRIKLDELERAVTAHDSNIKTLFAAVRQLMAPPEPKKKKIGFLVEEKACRLRTAPVPLSFRRFENSRNLEVPLSESDLEHLNLEPPLGIEL